MNIYFTVWNHPKTIYVFPSVVLNLFKNIFRRRSVSISFIVLTLDIYFDSPEIKL